MGGGLGDGGNLIGTMIGMQMANPIANQMGAMMQSSTQANANTPANSTDANDEIIQTLKQLGELKAAGVLTEEEFAEKKKDLLSKIK